MYKPIVITGPLASGKTTIAKAIQSLNPEKVFIGSYHYTIFSNLRHTGFEIIIVEEIYQDKPLEEIHHRFSLMFPNAQMIYTSPEKLEVDPGKFNHIKLLDHLQHNSYTHAERQKIEKWDALEKKIAACYVNEDGTPNEDPDIDLVTIGELAASAMGYL